MISHTQPGGWLFLNVNERSFRELVGIVQEATATTSQPCVTNHATRMVTRRQSSQCGSILCVVVRLKLLLLQSSAWLLKATLLRLVRAGCRLATGRNRGRRVVIAVVFGVLGTGSPIAGLPLMSVLTKVR